jgi:hypothetical protein
MVRTDQLTAPLDDLPRNHVAERQHAPANSCSGLQHRDIMPGVQQLMSRGQPRKPRPDHDHPLPRTASRSAA